MSVVQGGLEGQWVFRDVPLASFVSAVLTALMTSLCGFHLWDIMYPLQFQNMQFYLPKSGYERLRISPCEALFLPVFSFLSFPLFFKDSFVNFYIMQCLWILMAYSGIFNLHTLYKWIKPCTYLSISYCFWSIDLLSSSSI